MVKVRMSDLHVFSCSSLQKLFGASVDAGELAKLLNTKTQTLVAGASASNKSSDSRAKVPMEAEPEPELPLVSNRTIGTLIRLLFLLTRDSEKVAEMLKLLCKRLDADEQGRKSLDQSSIRGQRTELKTRILAAQVFENSEEEQQKILRWLQQHNLQLPDGVTVDKLPNLPAGEMAWEVVKPKGKNKNLGGVGVGVSLRLRLVSQIFRYWIEDKQGQHKHGAVSADYTALWSQLEYLTPPELFLEEFVRIAQFDEKLKQVVTENSVQRIREKLAADARHGAAAPTRPTEDEEVRVGGAEATRKKRR